MSKFHPPEAFTFHKPTEWPAWKAQISRFRLATELHKKTGDDQVSALVYAMGPEAEHVIQSFTFDATKGETETDYGMVLEKFNAHFVPKWNVIHECGRFCQRVQLSRETVEEFVRHLYEIVEHCDFGLNKEEFLRDRIVIGMADKELSERLQLWVEVNLQDAIHAARHSEFVKMQ